MTTIFALSTPSGRSALAIIRLSGPLCDDVLRDLKNTPELPAPRHAHLCYLHHPQTKVLLDEAVILRFKAPHSYTGEDMLELHLHGGRAVVAAVLDALSACCGLQTAGAGDFSRRAVLNGRLDLTQAEGIADLIAAETAAQHAQAFRQMRGALGRLYENWGARLKEALARVEADLEFADEDLPDGIGQAALDGLKSLGAEIAAHLADDRGQKLRDGIFVALVGAPNVGKSSLFNKLVGRAAAIVSPQAGTTRDIVEATLDMGGVPVRIADMAGLRAARDDIEREGVRRAMAAARAADIRVFICAPPKGQVGASGAGYKDFESPFESLGAEDGDFHLYNKVDLNASSDDVPAGDVPDILAAASLWVPISVKTGHGYAAFEQALTKRIAARFGASEAPVLTRLRHREALETALAGLNRALNSRGAGLETGQEVGLELAAEDLRLAMRAVGQITGHVDVEAVLDVVFADFCIGK